MNKYRHDHDLRKVNRILSLLLLLKYTLIFILKCVLMLCWFCVQNKCFGMKRMSEFHHAIIENYDNACQLIGTNSAYHILLNELFLFRLTFVPCKYI